MTDYSNWKIKKSVINYTGDDEDKITEARAAQKEYENASDWCDDNQDYIMSQDNTYYKTALKPAPIPPTDEEIRQMREEAYRVEVDPITSHISRLRDTTPMTPEVEAEIADLIVERDAKFQEIQERYPYNEETENEVS